MSIAVAIDGPAGAGKSTIARAAAKALGFIYVDTGALYRSIGLNAIRNGVDLADTNAIENSLDGIKVELAFDAQGAQIVLLNGEDVSSLIRTPEVSMSASKVSAVSAVRAFLLDLQRNMAKTQSVIMDGIDIGTVVLPNAEVKIFLTASPEIRAKRRFDELIEKGQDVKYEDVLADVIERDYNDSHREIAPLKPAEDSKLADTSGLTLEESIQLIINIIKENTK